MKAIILAAGVGSRIKEITKDIPKCLIEINGVPIIKQQISSLKKNGVEDISVVIGYKKEMVIDACKDLRVKFYENSEFKNTSMLESLYCAEKELNEEFIMIYGDIFFQPELIKKLLKDKSNFCLTVDNSKDFELDDEAVFEEYHGEKIRKGSTKVQIVDGDVKKISKKLEKDEINAEYIGVSKFSLKGAKIVKERIEYLIDSGKINKFPSPSYLFKWLIDKNISIRVVYVTEDDYAEIDYLKDLNEAKERFEAKIRGILFDAEDVIYYRDEETLKPIIDFFAGKKLNISYFDFREAYEKDKLLLYKGLISKDEHLKKVLQNLDINQDQDFFDEFCKVFREHYSNIKINDEVEELFKELKRLNIKIGILTDTFASEEKKRAWFRKINLEQYIDVIICSSETGFTKDDKESFLIGVEKLDLKPKEVVFVGHQKYEMQGSRKANVKSISIVKGIEEDYFVENILKIKDKITTI